MAHQKGAAVRLIAPVIEGQVKERKFIDASDSFEYLVEYVGADDEVHTRWFTEAQLEVVG